MIKHLKLEDNSMGDVSSKSQCSANNYKPCIISI